MVTFAPQVAPTNDPNYMNYSKPISDIQADKSSGLLLTALGEGIEGIAKVGDSITKSVINDEVTQGVDKQRDAFTSTLVAYADAQSGAGVIPSPQSQAEAGVKAPMTLAGGEENVPSGVKAGVERAQSIGAAMSQNSGKSNDTLYTGALTALTKDLRNRYPGYRDYIDEKISQVSGINPANAYMRNLLEDINRNATGGKAEVDKAIALGRQYLGYDPQMPSYIEAVRQGLPGSIQNLEGRINNVASDKIKFDELERVRKLRDWSREDGSVDQSAQFSNEIRSKANKAWEAVVQIPGLNDPKTIQQLIDDQRAGRIKLSDEQNGALLQAATLARDTWKRNAVEIMRARGYTSSIPDKKARDSIIEDEGRFFEDQITAINSKEYGTMYGNDRRGRAISSDTKVNLLSDRDMGAYWRTVDGVRAVGGDGWSNFMQAEAIKKGGPDHLKNFIQDETLKMSTPYDPRFPQDTKSIYDAVKKAQDAKVPASTKTYDNLVDNVKVLGMDSPPAGVSQEQFLAAKRNVTNYMFDPAKNEKLLDRFQRDFTDEQGVFHPGKFAIYDTMTQRSIVDNIWKSKDSGSWAKFRDWNELSFRKLFSEEVGLLSQLGDSPVKITWDSDKRQFSVERDFKPAMSLSPSERQLAKPNPANERAFAAAKTAIEVRLNKGLANLSYMQDKEGTDTSAYLMDTLMQMGYSPNDRLKGNNLPQRVIEAISHSKKQNRINEAFEAAKGSR